MAVFNRVGKKIWSIPANAIFEKPVSRDGMEHRPGRGQAENPWVRTE